jgi:fused signal recognition particle receptor
LLSGSRLSGKIRELIQVKPVFDEFSLNQLEEILISADVGVKTSLRLIEKLSASPVLPLEEREDRWEGVLSALRKEMLDVFSGKSRELTSDTFRAGAIEQLEIWAKRAGVGIVKQRYGIDPSAVAFDAVSACLARGIDVLIIDTAGRLHTKVNLMEELKKVKRVLGKGMPGAPHEILLVVDAATGQNALIQAKLFHSAIEVSGIALAKLDGTAKGGIVAAIEDELGIPVKLAGTGENLEDLQSFNPAEFVQALLNP